MITRHQIGTLVATAFIMALMPSTQAFSDVHPETANSKAINYLEGVKVLQGYQDGTFRPGNTINRAEFTKIIIAGTHSQAELEGCVRNNLSRFTFSDVDKAAWYYPYLCVATSGLQPPISGYPDGTFRPSQNITFVEAAKILGVVFDYSSYGDYEQYSAIWYAPYTHWLAEQKAIPRNIEGFDHVLTRGDMAELYYRILAKDISQPSLTYTEVEHHIGQIYNSFPTTVPSLPLNGMIPTGPYSSASVEHSNDSATYQQGTLKAVASNGMDIVLVDNLQKAAGLSGNHSLMYLSFSKDDQKVILYQTIMDTDAGITGLWTYDLKTGSLTRHPFDAYNPDGHETSPSGRFITATDSSIFWDSDIKQIYVLDLFKDKAYKLPTLTGNESYNGGLGGIGSFIDEVWSNDESSVTITVWDESNVSTNQNKKAALRSIKVDLK